MIAEEKPIKHNNSTEPKISINRDMLPSLVIYSLKKTVSHFKSYIIKHVKKQKLNEDELTQIFVEQLDIQLRKQNLPFGVKNQYQDIYNSSRGISDFYFHPIEENKSTASIFSFESKRLPPPTKDRKREYLIGKKRNGGIERYKIEMHGKGLPDCGLLGFIEKRDFTYWISSINKWIKEISLTDSKWDEDEILMISENDQEFIYLKSEVRTISDKEIKLHHFWIK